jgi:hypothetical protein
MVSHQSQPSQTRLHLSYHQYRPNMEAHVRQYVNKCQVCRKSKPPTKKYGILPETKIHYEPWEIIQIDLFGPWTSYDVDKVSHQIQGISIIDIATHWVELCPYTSKFSEDIALFGGPKLVCSLSAPQTSNF